MEAQTIELGQLGNETNGDISAEKKVEKVTPDFPTIRVTLPADAAIRVYSTLQALKERKSDTKADELLAEFLEGITQSYLDAQIEKRTPAEFYFEAARNIPELREKIIQQAKKALGKLDLKDTATLKVRKTPKLSNKKLPSEHTPESVAEALQ